MTIPPDRAALYDALLSLRTPQEVDAHMAFMEAFGERLGQVSSRAVVREHLVAAQQLDGRGERQWTGDLLFERADSICREFLEGVEVLGEQRASAPLIAARSAAS